MDAKYKGLNYREQQTEEGISVVKVREATTDLLSSNFDSLYLSGLLSRALLEAASNLTSPLHLSAMGSGK